MTQFSVLSWNIQGEWNLTGHTPHRKIRPHLLNSTADIIALQECKNAKKLFKDPEVLQNYHSFIPASNHSIILSKYPILRAAEVMFPRWNRKGNLESCSRADIQIGHAAVRIYNCHFQIVRAGPALRLKQLEYLLADAQNHRGPIILCGDLNTTIPQNGWNRRIIKNWHMQPKRDMVVDGKFMEHDERELINRAAANYGFREVADLSIPTWSAFKTKRWEVFKLKLDWFMVKGLNVAGYKLGQYVSDHKAIEVEAIIPD
jgi:endonuclease/exonuclease/phosphatase family metal-dependent hydrolase